MPEMNYTVTRLDAVRDEKLIGRLFNWKFQQAVKYLRRDHPANVRQIVKALAEMFANPGDAIDGHMGVLIKASLSTIMPEIVEVAEDAIGKDDA